MSDMLSIGSSALQAYRAALNVASNNIANANTAGYSRERIQLQAQPGVSSGSGQVGTGVDVQGVQRLTDSYLQAQLVSTSSSYSRINTLQGYASQLDSLLSSSSTSLSGPMQTFFTDLNSLSANPTSTATRQTVLTDAQGLASTFNGLQQQINTMSSSIDSSLSTTATQVNGYATQLAQLNQQISQASGQGQTPNTLLDRRDQLLQNVSADVGISTVTNSDGSVNVFLASGQPLVLGTNANSLAVQPNTFGQGQDLVLQSGKTSTVVTGQVSGGTIGGMLDFKKQILQPAANQLGQLALGLAGAVNAQQAQGVDQNGKLGVALFNTPTPQVSAASTNAGSGAVSATVADPSQLTASNALLTFNGSTWSMTNPATGSSIALSGSGTSADPLTGGGLQLTVSGTPAAGDQFLVQPTLNAAGALQVSLTSPAGLATASAMQTAAATGNSGNASIGKATVTDATNSSLLQTTQIQFTSASSYSVNGVGSYAYTSGSPIALNGWQVQITGTPAAGDQFTVSANSGSSSDNSNAQALAGILNKALLNGGSDTLSTANAALVSKVGAQAQQAATQLTAQSAIQTQVQTASSAVSGVSLDEEASNMLQFQQAYQAAAQIVSTSNTIFQSLLQAVQA